MHREDYGAFYNLVVTLGVKMQQRQFKFVCNAIDKVYEKVIAVYCHDVHVYGIENIGILLKIYSNNIVTTL